MQIIFLSFWFHPKRLFAPRSLNAKWISDEKEKKEKNATQMLPPKCLYKGHRAGNSQKKRDPAPVTYVRH